MRRSPVLAHTLLLAALVAVSGCQSLKYKAWEAIGVEKRELMVDRVEDARDAQSDAGEQFESTLEQFRAVVEFDGGNLEKLYNRLNDAYEDSVKRAERVSDRIEAVENVAEALFTEWERELEQYSSADLRNRSAALLSDTRARYRDMRSAMRRAERSIAPVLESFQDQVLFLKHNLNAMAVSSVRNELSMIESETESLLKVMRESIAEADRFIESLRGS